MPLALITGTRSHLGPAAETLGRAGFDVKTWPAGSEARPAGGPFDCYLQLPCATGGPSGRHAADDLVGRIDALAAVAERLAPNASVLLAIEEAGSSAELLAAVGLALLEDLGRSAARLAVLPVAELCQRVPQWEMPTPPLVSAP